MHILLLSLLLLISGLPMLAQSVSTTGIPITNSDIVKQTAESFLSACVQRDWKRASAHLSITSPLVLSDDRTAADDWLVGRLKKYEIREIDGEEWPTAVVLGCAKLSGRGRGTFEFILSVVTDHGERKIYHFELVHDDMESPPIKCSLRK